MGLGWVRPKVGLLDLDHILCCLEKPSSDSIHIAFTLLELNVALCLQLRSPRFASRDSGTFIKPDQDLEKD
jgi:hypothetical protein